MTIRQVLSQAVLKLRHVAGKGAALEAELLLAFILGKDRVYLLAHPEQILSARIYKKFLSLVHRRSRGEPVAYILGQKEFFGLSFKVNKQVLVPRPETEILVAQALQLAQLLNLSQTVFIDVGTGSGAIAVSLSKNLPSETKILALDISAAALRVAGFNILKNKAKNIRTVRSDLLSNLPKFSAKIMVVLANLPYVPTREMQLLPQTVKDFEPALALDGGRDGLKLYDTLLLQMKKKFEGKEIYFLYECDPSQVIPLKKLTKKYFRNISGRVFYDLSGKKRGAVIRIANHEL